MSQHEAPTILCLASHEKGAAFLQTCKQLGCRVFLITREQEANKEWPRESIDEFFYMPSLHHRQNIIYGISYLARHQPIDRIIALDDLDVEMAAALREHLRVPGMGETTARYFRDKLAMRVRAREAGIRVPPFIHVLNHERLAEWMATVSPPWVLKPRSEASSVGIKKVHHADEVWQTLDTLGDRQSFYVLEQFIAGTVYHVDGIISERETVFAEVHGYAKPPLSVMQGGGIFSSRTLARDSDDARHLRALNEHLLRELGLVRGITHTEFIKGDDDGEFYFLETAARVGGANIAEMVEAATGVNLWREWAKIEVANLRGESYTPPSQRYDYAGIVISLARQEHPDTSDYTDPEIVWRMTKRHHVGLIVASHDAQRVRELLDQYMARFAHDFLASVPPPETLMDDA